MTHPSGHAASKLGHSALGIASFALSLLTVAGVIGFYLAVNAAVARGVVDAANPPAGLLAAGMVFLVSVLVAVVGIGLGIAALVQKNRRRVLAWVGLALNSLVVLAVVVLIALGYALTPV
jgi:hypothetical protein